ncbi:hypothetical protein R6Q57_009025 [Mikania cordata]
MEERMTKTKIILAYLVVFYESTAACANAANTISANQTVGINETIVSPQETFELGFFSPGKSMNHYVGIWYKKISKPTYVWVANRNTPLTDTSIELTLTVQGVLIIRNTTTGFIIWSSTNSSTTTLKNPIGQLLDSGNFIIHQDGVDINQDEPIWQSFNFMTDNILPGMKHGRNFVRGIERHILSWKSDDDPAVGEYSDWIDTRGYPQLLVTKGQEIIYRAGPWNGLSPVCSCLKGFEPVSPDQWRVADWSQGCQHAIPLDCNPGEGFNRYSNLKLPDTQWSWYNQTMTLLECEKMCKRTCSCTAYTNSNISGAGSGCLLWFGELIDIRAMAENGDTLYIRLAASELGNSKRVVILSFLTS